MQKTNRQKLKDSIDKYFSLYIRLRYADEYGNTKCYTCDRVLPYKKVHAGHFMSRGKLSTRWDDRNVQVQCYGCNISRYGNQYEFGKRLDKTYGEGFADYLLRQSLKTRKFTQEELEALKEKYMRLAKEQLSERGLE